MCSAVPAAGAPRAWIGLFVVIRAASLSVFWETAELLLLLPPVFPC